MKHSRFGNLFTALAAAALILGACAPAATPTAAPTAVPQPTAAPQPTAPTPVTLHIMHNWADTDPKGPILKEVFDEFMAANPDVKLEVEVFSDPQPRINKDKKRNAKINRRMSDSRGFARDSSSV